jgi:hypothetical protein
MAYFAELDDQNNVIGVIVVPNDVLLDENNSEQESRGIDFCVSATGRSRWKQTSINTKDGFHHDPVTGEKSKDKALRHNFAEVGMIYIEDADVFVPKPPQTWFYLDEDKNWVCPPELGPHTGEPFTHDELVYIAHLINSSHLYSIVPLVPIDDDPLSIICTTTEYRLADITEITHGFNPHEKFYIQENGKPFPPYQESVEIILDLSPVGVITALHMKQDYEPSEEISKFYFEQHPQNEAFSPHECFRLLIEWAFAHTDFGNDEPMAILAHNFLRAVQMPIEVRSELINQVPSQVVELFLQNHDIYDPFYRIDSVDTPPLFSEWFKELRLKFPKRKIHDPLNVDITQLPLDYPGS